MFGFLKNLIGERGENSAPEPTVPAVAAPPAPDAASSSISEPTPVTPVAPESPPVTAATVAAATAAASKGRMERVLLPLKTITDRFPAPLKAVLATSPGGSVVVALPVEDILARLAQGKVEVSVGELRRVAPVNTFVADTSRDGEKVEIPLPELLAKLDPALLKPRSQQRVEIPQGFATPFARQAGNAPAPVPSAAKSSAPTPENPKDKLKKSGIVEASSELQALLAGIKKEVPATPVPAPSVPPKPASGSKPAQVISPGAPPRRQPIVDAPAIKLREAPPHDRPAAPAKPAPPVELKGTLPLPLAKISPGWPETIREEIATLSPDARVEFPAAELGVALRQGKVTVPWQRLRAMIVPKVAKAGDSLYDEALIELPLPVVAPIFMAASRAPNAQQRVTVDESLPVLFSASKPAKAEPAPEKQVAPPSPPPEAKPAPAPQVLKVEQPKPDVVAPKLEVPAPKPEAVASKPEIAASKSETIAPKPEAAPAQVKPALQQEAAPEAEAPKPGALGLDDRIPSELVARACTLNGVAGAVVALADGLLVSATVPPEFKAETIAAFLPQVFSRLEQAAGTMQIGELQTLMFTAGNRPWQIWRAGSLFFAAVGRPNELLPGAQLKIIAAQLARQVKA